jgi:6-phosphogluconolactonase/glucosamine-6-phosphate isomerase/deaminase
VTYPALNAARQVIFMATGLDKATAIKQVLQPAEGAAPLPAAGIAPANARVIWLLDESAACYLRPPLNIEHIR